MWTLIKSVSKFELVNPNLVSFLGIKSPPINMYFSNICTIKVIPHLVRLSNIQKIFMPSICTYDCVAEARHNGTKNIKSHLHSLKPIRVISHIKILLKDRWILVYGSGRLIIQKYNCNKAFDPTLVVELSILDANSFKYFHRMFDEPWETRAQYVKGWNYYTKHKTFRVVKFII